VLWQREESLAHIVAVHFADLPPVNADISTFTANLNPVMAFVERLTHSIQAISSLLQAQQEDKLVQDTFRRHKMLVAVTSCGLAVGVDTQTAAVVWTRPLGDVSPLRSAEVVLLRSALHGDPLVTVVMQPALPGAGAIVVNLDPLSGKVAGEFEALGQPVLRVIPLPHVEVSQTHLKVHALLLADKSVMLLPKRAPADAKLGELQVPLYTYVLDKHAGTVIGLELEYAKETDSFVARHRWQVQLAAPGDTVVAATQPYPQEPVASAGEILGDKSVMYKYLNPNMLAVATMTPPVKKASQLSVHLIDTVRGAVLQHVTHDGVTGPVHMAMAENWLLYSFRDRKNKRNSLNVIELFDPMDKVRLDGEERGRGGRGKLTGSTPPLPRSRLAPITIES
jgi:hypothetical protein